MLRSPTRHYSNLPKNIKVTSWRNIRNTILSTASSSFLCLSIIMVFLQWLVSKQLLLGFFSKFDIIYLCWRNTSVNKNNNKMKEGTYNGLQSSYNNGKKCITFMFMDRRYLVGSGHSWCRFYMFIFKQWLSSVFIYFIFSTS